MCTELYYYITIVHITQIPTNLEMNGVVGVVCCGATGLTSFEGSQLRLGQSIEGKRN